MISCYSDFCTAIRRLAGSEVATMLTLRCGHKVVTLFARTKGQPLTYKRTAPYKQRSTLKWFLIDHWISDSASDHRSVWEGSWQQARCFCDVDECFAFLRSDTSVCVELYCCDDPRQLNISVALTGGSWLTLILVVATNNARDRKSFCDTKQYFVYKWQFYNTHKCTYS